MNNIIRPLRLAVGSHRAGSGKGCAMNVVSWMNGDRTITDMPDCADPMLARFVQFVNDGVCPHRNGDLLCAECSVKVLGLAFRTVGTAGLATPSDHARLARWAADRAAASGVVGGARASAASRAASDAAHDAANAADAWRAAARAAADAAAYSIVPVAPDHVVAAAAASAAARVAHEASDAARAATIKRGVSRVAFGHALIDEFDRITGRTPTTTPNPETVNHAITRMEARA